MKQDKQTITLFTPEGEQMIHDQGSSIPWSDYPRPQLMRQSYLCLNGEWEFGISTDHSPCYDERILVPFVPESVLSGIGRRTPRGARLCYRRGFSLPCGFCRDRVLLHFGAVDQVARVTLNGTHLGEHRGGYDAFSFDITPYLQEKNTLEVVVTDTLGDGILPYGKQKHNRGGMWYTPVSGIWQTVWLESVPATYVTQLHVTADTEGATVCAETNAPACPDGTLVLHLPSGDRTLPFQGGRVRITVDDPILWSPETPHLYRFTLCVGEDSISSYFALRTLDVRQINGKARLCLNGRPYFFHGLLDQGYFSDGIFLPASPEGYVRDIEAAKHMGFTMLRKHIKVEPSLFYYACDRLGMTVFQDMVNNGHYSFIRDTALPTVGLKRRSDRRMHRDEASRKAFLDGMASTVRQVAHHPSVCAYTIFNEGWGQFDHEHAYTVLRGLDSTRFIDSVSGWFTPRQGITHSDVESLHVYFKPVRIKPAHKPVFLSEFGGYVLKIDGHSFSPGKPYGYRFFDSSKALTEAIDTLYRSEVIPAVSEGLCGSVYTQLSDVEDETNGLLTYDRKVLKVDEERMRSIAMALQQAIKE